jgi:hypothetical protein
MKPLHFDNSVLIVGSIAPLVSFLIGCHVHDATWFERSGSLMTFASAFVGFRQIARVESEKRSILVDDMTFDKPIPGTSSDQDLHVSRLALICMAIGTLIWGYGAPIYRLIGICKDQICA